MRVLPLRPTALRCALLLSVACGVGAPAAPAVAAPSLLRVCRALDPSTGSSGIVSAAVRVSTASPWRPARRSRVRYVAAGRGSAGRSLAVCAVRGRSTAVALDLRARLGPGERLVRAAVADPWVAWVTRGRGAAAQDVVHWQRLGGGERQPAGRRAGGRVTGLVPTVEGRVLVQATSGSGTRLSVLRRGEPERPVVLDGPGSRAARRGTLVRWTPTDAAITAGPRTARRRAVLPIDPDAARLRRRCRPAAQVVGRRLATDALGADLLAADSWAGTSGYASPSVERGMELCAPDGTLASAVLLTLDSSHHDEDDERGWGHVALAGPVALVREMRVNGISGSGTEAEPVRGAYVRDAAGRTTERHPTLVAAGPSAGAFVADGRLWVTDADGLRQVAVAGALDGPTAALRVRATDVVVRTTAGDQVVPVRPLPAAAFATAPFGSPPAEDLAADDLCPHDAWRDDLRCTIPAAPAP